MITAHKKNHAKRISGPTKLNIALHAIRRQHSITEISRQFDCSRTTVYNQQDKALSINQSYDFIVAEMESLALKHPHRIDDIVSSLQSRREAYFRDNASL